MAADNPTAALLRKTARSCRAAADASTAGDDPIAQKFLALAADLDVKAAQIERGSGNGSA